MWTLSKGVQKDGRSLFQSMVFTCLFCGFIPCNVEPMSVLRLSGLADSNRPCPRSSLWSTKVQASTEDSDRPIFVFQGTLRLRGAGKLDLRGYRAVGLEKTVEWLQATTFDGSEVQSPFSAQWEWEDTPLDVRLWMAAELNDGGAATRLVEAGADINSANDAGQTALHKAAMMGHPNIYCLGTLVALGADLFAKDTRNFTAVDYARESFEGGFGPEDAVELLEQAMAVVGGKKFEGKHNATAEGAEDEETDFPPRDLLMVQTGSGRFVPVAPELVAIDDKDTADNKVKEGETDAVAGDKPEEDKKKKKKKRKYGSAKERWRSLKEHKKKRAARMQGEEV